jgi:hypothetical protein
MQAKIARKKRAILPVAGIGAQQFSHFFKSQQVSDP